MHPSGTFYFDTLRMSSLYLWREFGDLRSEMGFFPLVWGTLSVRGGLVWILPEQEMPKVSLKCSKVCLIRFFLSTLKAP